MSREKTSTDQSLTDPSAASKEASLSLDAWAVIVALVLALAVRFHLVDSVPW
jgi:hypothetical protein